MSTYYNGATVREIDDALFAEWLAAGNPKAQGWTLRPDAPAYDPATHQCAWDGSAWVVSALPVVIPEEVTYRQAKTLMELTPNAQHGNMWLAAIAAAEAIQDPVTRIVTRNYIQDSQVYERARVHGMCALLGMTATQADQMMVAASKL